MTCPECGAVNSTVYSTGLGGRWKAVCRQCLCRIAEGTGVRDEPADDAGKTEEE